MKGRAMRVILLTTALWCLSSPAIADNNPMPPPPEGGLTVMQEGACKDIETQVEGYCVLSTDVNGNIYLMFAIDGELVEIRQVVGDGYITIWKQTPGELM
jgi:hypothetical protein